MIKGIYGILGAMIIWLCLLTSNMASKPADIKPKDKKIEQRKSKPKIKVKQYASKEFEKKYFKQAFAQMRKLHGAGHVFIFNGNLYTTDYKEEK
jgi:hypothetical protein